MSKIAHIKRFIKSNIRSLLPLSIRKHMAVWIDNQEWLGYNRRSWWSQELIHDLAIKNINEYHKFLWSNHLSYAATYQVASRFGHENMKQSRKMFFLDLRNQLIEISLIPEKDIKSVFEVGCSLGYQLRYLETDLFPSATKLKGIDIDKYAIQAGAEYLKSIRSNIQIKCADMENLDSLMGNKIYDIIICSGVLMYLSEDAAARIVAVMLRHAGIMLAFTGLAHSDIDNSELQHSVIRGSDKSFIHNIDSMVKKAGGTISGRRWEGGNLVDGHTIYFVFAQNNKNKIRN